RLAHDLLAAPIVVIPGVVEERDTLVNRRVHDALGFGVTDGGLTDVPAAQADDGDVHAGLAQRPRGDWHETLVKSQKDKSGRGTGTPAGMAQRERYAVRSRKPGSPSCPRACPCPCPISFRPPRLISFMRSAYRRHRAVGRGRRCRRAGCGGGV